VRLVEVVAPEVCARWLEAIEARYARVDRSGEDPEFARHSSSLRLRSVDGLAIDAVLRQLMSGELAHRLDGFTLCDVDECWVRRQYAPANAPPDHAPHSWHQDGALKFDFAACTGSPPANALLQMLTCWIPLIPCGEDAPGLELVLEPLARLLSPPELTPDRISEAYRAECFERPSLQPGDALLLRGDTLHRTHVTPQMTRDRTSIELRFFAQPLPERLRADRFVAVRG
jgi:hypothetical protein